jgi:hypothetical protein
MYKKLLNEVEDRYQENKKEMEEKNEEIKVKLERTENIFQSKRILIHR